MRAALTLVVLAAILTAGCGLDAPHPAEVDGFLHSTPRNVSRDRFVPPPADNIYAYAGAADLSPVVRRDRALVYVPNSMSDSVTVISQRTLKVVGQFPTGALPQHVTPAYNLRTLYVDNDLGNSLTLINPRTGAPGRPIPVEDPYNLYFTPDGRFCVRAPGCGGRSAP
jgi:YVTN family beta-propeller protein